MAISTFCPCLTWGISTSGTLASTSKPLATATIEVDVAEASLEAEIAGLT